MIIFGGNHFRSLLRFSSSKSSDMLLYDSLHGLRNNPAFPHFISLHIVSASTSSTSTSKQNHQAFNQQTAVMSAATLNLSKIGQSDPVCIEDWTQTTANLPAFFNQAPLVAALDGPVSAQHEQPEASGCAMGNHHGSCPVSALNGLALSSHHRQKFLAEKTSPGGKIRERWYQYSVNWTG